MGNLNRLFMIFILIGLATLFLTAGIAVLIVLLSKKKHVVDGPGMVFRWDENLLLGNWIQVDKSYDGSKARITVDKTTFKIKGLYGENKTSKYTIPDWVTREGLPNREISLSFSEPIGLEGFLFSVEKTPEGETFPVLSGTIFEYDGRGEIVIIEFVREQDQHRVTEDFQSSVCKRRNSWEGVPKSYMEVKE